MSKHTHFFNLAIYPPRLMLLSLLLFSLLTACQSPSSPHLQTTGKETLPLKFAQSNTAFVSFERQFPSDADKNKYKLLNPSPETENFRLQEFLAAPYIPEEYSDTVGTQWGDGSLRWNFRVRVPSSRPTSIIITLTGNQACQSVFAIRRETFTTLNPDSTGSHTEYFSIGVFASTVDGSYNLNLADELGHSYNYTVFVKNGVPAVCPTPTPVPTPTAVPTSTPAPSSTPEPCKGNPKNCVSPTPTPSPSDEPCPCQGNGFAIQANSTCPPCSEEDRIPGNPCDMISINPKTGKPLKPQDPQKITFIGSYDFDRRQDRNSRDVELAFVIKPYTVNGVYGPDGTLENISINNNKTLVNHSGLDTDKMVNGKLVRGQHPSDAVYQEKFRQDAITDTIYNNGYIPNPTFGFFKDVPGCPKMMDPYSAILFVSANLSVLPATNQVISVTIPSQDGKNAFTAKLKLTKATDGNKNWERIDCVK
ncbi:MAG: hypothetical protein AB7I41_13425 [Candidatus Sericytochromatia bacterium]